VAAHPVTLVEPALRLAARPRSVLSYLPPAALWPARDAQLASDGSRAAVQTLALTSLRALGLEPPLAAAISRRGQATHESCAVHTSHLKLATTGVAPVALADLL
jgi:hypothetical protein